MICLSQASPDQQKTGVLHQVNRPKVVAPERQENLLGDWKQVLKTRP